MTYFLERIATLLYDEYPDRLDKQCLVFPNRRAGLYFLKYLSLRAGKPVWAPTVKTINELFQSYCPLQLAEDELLIFELYKVYKNLYPEAESFDDFYFWGDMLLNDFDDVDKYLVNASKLFTNLSDIKKIDSAFGGLSPEQVKIIKQFWVNFSPDSTTKQKTDFLGIWSILPELYSGFRDTLARKSFAYEGMTFRDVAEKWRNGNLPVFKWDFFHFIGFNALNNCEKTLMQTLKKAGAAKFYWDYDNSFVKEKSNHSAGFFIRQNISDLGNDMPSDWKYDTFITVHSTEIRRRVIDASSDVAQVKLVSQLLKELPDISEVEAHHTAIVLADENLLVPALTSLPETFDNVNITMGFPLKFSPVYSLVKQILTLQKNSRIDNGEVWFDHKDVFNILKHSFFSDFNTSQGLSITSDLINKRNPWISPQRFKGIVPFDEIFIRPDAPSSLSGYLKKILENLFISNGDEVLKKKYSGTEISIRNEFIYRTLLAINRLDDVVSNAEIFITIGTYIRLLDKILRGLSIPFSGEPLNGIQIMGILETRALDFRNLIILSVNEGILPRSTAGSSYIPYSLREAFGLPTIRHHDSIYAYYFYRLLQRAENVTFLYNSNSEGLRTGEMSRYLLQLKYLYDTPPEFASLGYEITTRKKVEQLLVRNESHIEKLEKLYLGSDPKLLSPSAVNTWLSCRMKFYYRYLCGLKESEKIVSEIDPALFGELLHAIMERIYSPLKGEVLNKTSFDAIRKNDGVINRIIGEIIIEKYHGDDQNEITGSDQIIGNILSSYVHMILRLDTSFSPLIINQLEEWVSSNLEIAYKNKTVSVKAGGVIDRVDYTGGTHRIIDYKTGNIEMKIDSIETLFDEYDYRRNEAWFQILMYCELFARNNPETKVRPSLYAVRNLAETGFSDQLFIKNGKDGEAIVNDYSEIRNEYMYRLKSSIESIFSTSEPFIMTEHRRKCEFCPYKQLCQR
jgi:CRISPR/Cas system-associated exonuclease Cas4 (RecB family)